MSAYLPSRSSASLRPGAMPSSSSLALHDLSGKEAGSTLTLLSDDGRPLPLPHTPPPFHNHPAYASHPSYASSAPMAGGGGGGGSPRTPREKQARYYPAPRRVGPRIKWKWAVPIVLAVVVGIVLLCVIPIILARNKAAASATTPSRPPSGYTPTTTSSAPTATQTSTTGTNGSLIVTDTGASFIYVNNFGGSWVDDPSDPFNDGAKAQSYTPALNESWQYGVDIIRGVNLGGWLVTEPFIVPALYEPYAASQAPAMDEWTLMEAMAKVGNATAMMDQHYSTFITEQDFANIAAAGLNWVRLPIPYWMIEVYPNEPFIPRLSWTYFLKAVRWARKYGLRINMDLHTIPGSQNGWNHSGKGGSINFLFGVMGIANAQRTLDYIRTLTEFVTQPEYSNVVPMFGVVNEALVPTIGLQQIRQFYYETYTMMRGVTGVGKGPAMSIHDGFQAIQNWTGYLSGSDRIMIDTHQYAAFTNPRTTDLFTAFTTVPCANWAPGLNQSMGSFGMTTGGEWAVSLNDCGKWLNGVNSGALWDGTAGTQPAVGSCTDWTDYQNFNASMKAGLMKFALAQMDGLQNHFYWTWKIGASSVSGKVESPLWSYSLGLANGWLPTDPRQAAGYCSSALGVAMDTPAPALSAWMTGGAGAGTIAATQVSSYSQWPLQSMNSVSSLSYIPPASVALLPQYTPTGAPVTLPALGVTASPVPDGWFNPSDAAGYYTAIAGCTYPDGWDAQNATIPGSACLPAATPSRKRDAAPLAVRTPPPSM